MSVQFLQKSNFDPSKIDIMKVIDVMVGSLSHSAIFQKPKVFITPDFFHSAIFQKPKGFITPDFFIQQYSQMSNPFRIFPKTNSNCSNVSKCQ